ncbi:MAG: hypothetical protein ACI4TT_03155 [Christensenellales bacterium]
MEKEILKLLKKIESLEDRVSLLEKKFEECQSANKQDFMESEKKPSQTSNRDKTKYVYNGKILPKNRLVFAVVSDYVKNNKQISLAQLQTIFDKSLQGSLQVVEDFDKVQKIKDYGKRYFCNDNEIISLTGGEKVVVCTQWGIFNIKKFILVAKQLGYEIVEL